MLKNKLSKAWALPPRLDCGFTYYFINIGNIFPLC
jgi:hypothetical protein